MRSQKSVTVNPDLHPLDRSKLCNYERWAQDFFTDPKSIQNPYLDITLQLDITSARQHYEAQPESTFTAFLYFYLIQALKKHPEFFYRLIDNQWILIKNPPLFFPIARHSKKDRFYEAIIPDIFQLSWKEFSQRYQTEIEKSKNDPQLIATDVFNYSLFIGNLPNLQITGLTLHVNNNLSCQPYFYFGKRYQNEKKHMVSLCIKFHHSSVDPFIIDLLIQDFQKQFTND